MACLTRSSLALLLLAACGPGTDDSASASSTTQTASTGDTGSTSSPTTGSTSTAATDTSGSTTTPTTGGAACPGEFPQDGTPCDAEGLICGGPCEDPCSFCNLSSCEGGVWTQLEAPPANCLDCETICPLVVAAGCAGGPPDQAACVSGCQAIQGGACGILYNETLACAGGMPTFTCDPMTRPTIAGCEAQFDALYQCTGT